MYVEQGRDYLCRLAAGDEVEEEGHRPESESRGADLRSVRN
jgi:hypothetical protein